MMRFEGMAMSWDVWGIIMMNLKWWVVLMLVGMAACEILTLDKSVLNQIYQESSRPSTQIKSS